MARNHGKGHHGRFCVYVSNVEKKNDGNNNSNPQVPDCENILSNLFEGNCGKNYVKNTSPYLN